LPIQTETITQAPDLVELEQGSGVAQPSTSEVSLLDITVLLVRHKRFVLWFVLVSAVLATVTVFLLPVRYEGKVVLLPPHSQNSSLTSSLLGQMGGPSGALGSLGAIAGGFGMRPQSDMYVSLLKSRTVEDAMIRRFGLVSEYHLKRMSDTRKELERRTSIVAGTKDTLITLTLQDRDPQRAAELANGYVDEFRKLTATLAITEAARRRLFFEQQLQPAKDNLAAAEEAMRKTQESTGVLQIDSQARALIESVALLRAQVVAKEVQVQAMRSFAAEDNPDLILAKQGLAALQKQLEQLAGSQNDTGSDMVLSKGKATRAGLEYLRHYRDLKYYEAVYELLIKGLEVAKLDEAREGEIVQVVDQAVPPDQRAFPHRTLIVLIATAVAFLAAVFWVVLRRGLERIFEIPENQRRLEAIKLYWKGAGRT
jgi:tyrosine-protein kinase Etk/Wzc